MGPMKRARSITRWTSDWLNWRRKSRNTPDCKTEMVSGQRKRCNFGLVHKVTTWFRQIPTSQVDGSTNEFCGHQQRRHPIGNGFRDDDAPSRSCLTGVLGPEPFLHSSRLLPSGPWNGSVRHTADDFQPMGQVPGSKGEMQALRNSKL